MEEQAIIRTKKSSWVENLSLLSFETVVSSGRLEKNNKYNLRTSKWD